MEQNNRVALRLNEHRDSEVYRNGEPNAIQFSSALHSVNQARRNSSSDGVPDGVEDGSAFPED